MVNSATVFENIKHILFKPEFKKNEKCIKDSILTQHRIQKEQVKVLLNYLAGGLKAVEEEDILWMDDCLSKTVIVQPSERLGTSASYSLTQKAISEISNYEPLSEEVLNAYVKLLVT